MTEELDLVVTRGPHPIHVRVRAGLRKSKNWRQLAKFLIVGGSGYVVNLCVFALCFEVLDLHHLIAATAAFVVGVANNFWWNRHWTFRAGGGSALFQAPRFLTVSVVPSCSRWRCSSCSSVSPACRSCRPRRSPSPRPRR